MAFRVGWGPNVLVLMALREEEETPDLSLSLSHIEERSCEDMVRRQPPIIQEERTQ